MSWVSIPVAGGRLKIKRAGEMRWPERERQVWVLKLGSIVISWWSRKAIDYYQRNG